MRTLDQFSIPLDWLICDTSNFFSFLAEQTPSELNGGSENDATLFPTAISRQYLN